MIIGIVSSRLCISISAVDGLFVIMQGLVGVTSLRTDVGDDVNRKHSCLKAHAPCRLQAMEAMVREGWLPKLKLWEEPGTANQPIEQIISPVLSCFCAHIHLTVHFGWLGNCTAFPGTLMHSITPAMVLDEYSGDMKLTFVCKDIEVRHKCPRMDFTTLPSNTSRTCVT